VHSDQRPATTRWDRALANVHALMEWNRRDSGINRLPANSSQIHSVGIVGAGIMGSAIAATHVRRNRPVVINDADRSVLDTAPEKIAAELADEAPAAEVQRLVTRLVQPTTDPARLGQCDLVIESIVETLPAKQRLFAALQPHLGNGTTLASNTSTIPIQRLAAVLTERSNFCGFHFFHPVRGRPLVEIIRGPQTSDRTIASVVAHGKAIDKLPIVVGDGPGFLVNRLLLPYLCEALDLLLEGAGVEAVEQAATAFGMAKGPLRLLDEIGLDTTLQGGWVLSEAFPDRIAASPLLVAMIKAGRLGQKSGAGFFSYDGEPSEHGAVRPDPEVERIIASWVRPPQRHTPRSITVRLLLPMLLEATRILQEGKVRDPRDIDLGVLFGLGFPDWRGGLLWWADTLGAKRVIEMLKPLAKLGARCHTTSLLHEMAAEGRRFYEAEEALVDNCPAEMAGGGPAGCTYGLHGLRKITVAQDPPAM